MPPAKNILFPTLVLALRKRTVRCQFPGPGSLVDPGDVLPMVVEGVVGPRVGTVGFGVDTVGLGVMVLPGA